MTLQDLLQRAFALHGAGNLTEAERHYRDCLAINPDHFDTLHWLGVLRAQCGMLEDARALLAKALQQNGRSAEAHTNHGNVLRALGRFDEALASYDQALAIRSDFPEVLCNRGAVLHDLGRYEEALASYDDAVSQRPEYAEAFNNRGNTLCALQCFEEALWNYGEALAIRSDYVEALNNRSVALEQLGRPEEALASVDNALALRPEYADALSNRANILCSLRRFDEALTNADRALALAPDHSEALNNRGNALQYLKRYDEALVTYDRSLALRPGYIQALNNRANVLRDLHRLEEALAICDQALALHPDYALAWSNRGEILRALKRFDEAARDFGRALEIDPDLPEVKGALLHSRMHCCDWSDYSRLVSALVSDARSGKRSCAPFAFLTISESPEDQLRCAQTWVQEKAPAMGRPLWNGERYAHERIRVAYLSADFHEHATMHLMAGLLESHDRARFEITAFSFGPIDAGDAMQVRVQAAVDRFIDTSALNDGEAARLLRDLEIDIAVDLKGFTTHSRPGILAFRPAPVQVNYLGYPGTLACDYIHYIVADPYVIPPQHQPWYSERVIYLPHSYQVNDRKRKIAERNWSRAEAGLPEHGIVFCSFNNSYKIHPRIFDVWMRLLAGVAGSVLWLLESNSTMSRNLRREAAARGVAPERLVFAPFAPPDEHLARHRLADLFLDTLPYNAHTTASDALWAGLPVVTCTGETFAGRVATSLLHAVGLSQLVTHDLLAYEALAGELATKPTRLREVKETLAVERTRSPLFDTDRVGRHLEAAYTEMWERSQRGEQPASFAVADRAN